MPGSQSIEGLMSGLDVTSIVDSIIESERKPVSIMEQSRDFKTQQVGAYQAVLAKFLSMETAAGLLQRESQFERYSVSVSDETVLTATSGSNVATGNYKVRVQQLAQNQQIASQGFDDVTDSTFGTGTIELSLGDSGSLVIDIDSTNNSLTGIKDAINDADIGVTASIINDGSSSNPYRLLLTGDETGAGQNINYSFDLSGGDTLDFDNGSFDNPEEISFSNDTTSAVSLGSTASFSGNENKLYTFTVQNSGTIGTDNITITWSDGTNSDSILVTEADSEVEVLLGGLSHDGMKLSFSAGDLTAGDTFQVATFAPTIQESSNAKIAIGGSENGSPIIATSTTNKFTDVVPGLTLNVANTNDPSDPNDYVTIQTNRDTEGIRNMINDFVTKYNDAMSFIEDQFSFDTETTESGVLFGDYSLQIMQSSVQLAVTSPVSGLSQLINSLSAIGVRTDADGKLYMANASALTEAIEDNFSDFKKLFLDFGDSSANGIEFVSAGTETLSGEAFNVNITGAASKGYFQGAAIADPSVTPLTIDSLKNEIQITVNGKTSDIIRLSERTYTSGQDLADEIQNRIEDDDKLDKYGIEVEWVDEGSSGYLKIISGAYGDNSSVKIETTANTANQLLGLHHGTAVNGTDVEGTINGEAATGNGQILEGDEDNEKTAGLKLKVTLSSLDDISSSVDGTITVTKGLASVIEESLNNITKGTEGSIDRQISGLNSQIDDLNGQIDDYEERLDARREDLYKQYTNLETMLTEYQAQADYLSVQLNNIQSNWNQIFSS